MAATLVLMGIVDLMFMSADTIEFGVGRAIRFSWIGNIIIGLGLLRFKRRVYVLARWWLWFWIVKRGAVFVWLMVICFQVSDLDFWRLTTSAFLLLVGQIALSVWQLWVLRQQYTQRLYSALPCH